MPTTPDTRTSTEQRPDSEYLGTLLRHIYGDAPNQQLNLDRLFRPHAVDEASRLLTNQGFDSTEIRQHQESLDLMLRQSTALTRPGITVSINRHDLDPEVPDRHNPAQEPDSEADPNILPPRIATHFQIQAEATRPSNSSPITAFGDLHLSYYDFDLDRPAAQVDTTSNSTVEEILNIKPHSFQIQALRGGNTLLCGAVSTVPVLVPEMIAHEAERREERERERRREVTRQQWLALYDPLLIQLNMDTLRERAAGQDEFVLTMFESINNSFATHARQALIAMSEANMLNSINQAIGQERISVELNRQLQIRQRLLKQTIAGIMETARDLLDVVSGLYEAKFNPLLNTTELLFVLHSANNFIHGLDDRGRFNASRGELLALYHSL